MSQATATAAAPAAPAKRGKGKLLIIVGIVLALLAAGGAAAYVLNKKKHDEHAEAADADEADADARHAKPAKKKKKKSEGAPVFIALEPFTVNLADTDTDRLAQIAVVLEADDKKADEALKAQMPAVRNAVLLLLSSKTSRELLTLEGKQKLAAEIAEAAGKRLDEGTIETVNFSQFIVQ